MNGSFCIRRWAYLLLLMIGCNGPEAQPTQDGGPTDAIAVIDSSVDGGANVDAGTCAAETNALSDLLQAGGTSCSVVVRLDHDTFDILGYQFFCSDAVFPNFLSEEDARAIGENDTGVGADAVIISSADGAVPYIFVESRSEPQFLQAFGVVSSVSAMSLFSATTVVEGTGEITYPLTWRNATELGVDCPPNALSVGSGLGYDLTSAVDLERSDIENAKAALANTVVLSSIEQSGLATAAAFVLRYARTDGPVDFTTGEWIVIVEAARIGG